MLTVFAAFVFSAAALLAIGTIGWMFLTYRDKMVAALSFEPMPETPRVYEIRIRRPRVFNTPAPQLSLAPRAAFAA
jgi:hypothetical protein